MDNIGYTTTKSAIGRRGALAVVAGALGAGTAVVAGATLATVARAKAEADPDAALIALCKQALEAELAHTDADMAEDHLCAEYWKRQPKKPIALRQTSADMMWLGHGVGAPHRTDKENPKRLYFTQRHIDHFRSTVFKGTFISAEGIEERPDRRTQARADEIVAAWDEWKEDCRRVRDEIGLTAARERSEAARQRWSDLEDEVLAAKATTLAGLIAKACIIGQFYFEDSGEDFEEIMNEGSSASERLACSIARDLMLMGKEAPRAA